MLRCEFGPGCNLPVLLESPNFARLVYPPPATPAVAPAEVGGGAGAGGTGAVVGGALVPLDWPPSLTIVTPPEVRFTSLCEELGLGRLLQRIVRG